MKTYRLPGYVTLVTPGTIHGLKLLPCVRENGHIVPIDRKRAAQLLRSDRQRQRALREKAYGALQASGYSEIDPTTGESVREPRNEVRTKGGRLPGGWLRMR